MKVLEIAMKIPSIPMVPKSDGDRSRASNKPNRKFTIWVENFSIAVHLTPDIVSDFRLSILLRKDAFYPKQSIPQLACKPSESGHYQRDIIFAVPFN